MGLLPFRKFGLAPSRLIELSNSLICSTPVEITLDNTDLRFVLFDLRGYRIKPRLKFKGNLSLFYVETVIYSSSRAELSTPTLGGQFTKCQAINS